METKQPFLWIDTTYVNNFGFTVPTTWTSLNPATLTVPQGYTQVMLQVQGQFSVNCRPTNSNTADWFSGRVYVDAAGQTTWCAGLTTYGSSDGAGNSAMPMPWVSQWPSLTWIFSGLQGGQTINCYPQVESESGWTANSGNFGGVLVSAIFMP